MYDEFKLDEQEELWGLAAENEDGLSEGSDDESEGDFNIPLFACYTDGVADVPHRTPSKKPDDEPVVNHKRDREPPASPLLKKAPARSQYTLVMLRIHAKGMVSQKHQSLRMVRFPKQVSCAPI